jgi:hypothetical protein
LEPETIEMTITILDNEVTFDYSLKHDTPEMVAEEFVTETKLEKVHAVTIRDAIQKILDNYLASKFKK